MLTQRDEIRAHGKAAIFRLERALAVLSVIIREQAHAPEQRQLTLRDRCDLPNVRSAIIFTLVDVHSIMTQSEGQIFDAPAVTPVVDVAQLTLLA